MTQLTKNFTLEEFLINQTEKPSEEVKKNLKSVAIVLQKYRDTIFGNQSIKIHSGWRSEKYNKSIGGAAKSYHVKGLAADFSVKGFTKDQIYALMNIYHFGGVEHYNNAGWTICHIDLRGFNARFDSNNNVLKCLYDVNRHNEIFYPTN